MVALIARLFCAAALASVAVGTLPSLSIVSPANYTAFKAGEAFDLTLKITVRVRSSSRSLPSPLPLY